MSDRVKGDVPLHRLSDSDLREMSQGCTELTCLYHGAVNAERRRRSRIMHPAATAVQP